VSITWFLDGSRLAEVTSTQSPIPDEPMELIMSLQVADSATWSWHTMPDASTPTSDTMEVKEVKVTAQ
jgi:beta-glucanase (GH16 family)